PRDGARGRRRPRLHRHRRELRRRDGVALQPAPAGERQRQLRQGGAADPRPDPARPEPARDGAPAPRHVRRAEGQGAVSEPANISSEESLRITRERGWTGGHNPWTVALVVTMATFMEVLDTAIANVSLRHIAGDLSVG